jgi:hypothetical protein
LSRFAIFLSYTFLIFSTYSLTSVATTVVYVLVVSTVIAFSGETQSKSEDEDSIGGKEEDNDCSQLALTNSSQIKTFFLHIKQQHL